jgi:N-methylhydantoinase A/oxoprolinase/acetone carboxylase beta subunit
VVEEDTHQKLQAHLDAMVAQAHGELAGEGIDEHDMVFNGLVDMRYQGQAYELTIPFSPSTPPPNPLPVPQGFPSVKFREGEQDGAQGLVQRFHQAHEHTYGHSLPGCTVEVVNMRLQAVGIVDKPVLEAEPIANAGTQRAVSLRDAFLGYKTGLSGDTIALYDRESLPPGACFDGSALAFQLDSTVYVAPGWSARVDRWRNLVVEWERNVGAD